MAIEFGTEGWRGIISKDFTFTNLRVVAQAVADYLLAQGKKDAGVLIGYDTRFLSEEYACTLAKVLAANGVKVSIAASFVPTPVLSYCVREFKARCGLMVTASHNPACYNGIKIKEGYGGPAAQDVVEKIANYLYLNTPKEDAGTEIVRFDPMPAYQKGLRANIDFARIREAGLKVIIDPMHGAVQGHLASILKEAGVEVQEIRGTVNPSFGGINPEPIPPNLEALEEEVRTKGADFGIANDGDGDRIGVIDEQGNYIGSQRLLPFFIRYLHEGKGKHGIVVKTFSTSKMVDRVCKYYHLPLYETPIGFKHICRLFLEENVLLGGEESGGIGFQGHLPERDGIFAALLLAEALNFYRKPLHRLIKELEEQFGPLAYQRLDIELQSRAKLQTPERIAETPPREFAGFPVVGVTDLDGTKLLLPDERWILFRTSGTEPVIRLYAEAHDMDEVIKMLKAGKELLGV